MQAHRNDNAAIPNPWVRLQDALGELETAGQELAFNQDADRARLLDTFESRAKIVLAAVPEIRAEEGRAS